MYPHQQDTGGFFVAVFRKVKPISIDAGREEERAELKAKAEAFESKADKYNYSPTGTIYGPCTLRRKRGREFKTKQKEERAAAAAIGDLKHPSDQRRGFKEDPFVFRGDDGDQWWPAVKKFYGFSDSFPEANLYTRTKQEKKRFVRFATAVAVELFAVRHD